VSWDEIHQGKVAAAAAAAAEAAAAPAVDIVPVAPAVVSEEPNDAAHDHGVTEDGLANGHGSASPSVDRMIISDHHHPIANGVENGLENSHDDDDAMEAKPTVLLHTSTNRRKTASPSMAAGARAFPTTPPTAKRAKYSP